MANGGPCGEEKKPVKATKKLELRLPTEGGTDITSIDMNSGCSTTGGLICSVSQHRPSIVLDTADQDEPSPINFKKPKSRGINNKSPGACRSQELGSIRVGKASK